MLRPITPRALVLAQCAATAGLLAVASCSSSHSGAPGVPPDGGPTDASTADDGSKDGTTTDGTSKGGDTGPSPEAAIRSIL